MNSQKKIGLVSLLLIAAIAISSAFQNCAKTNYQGLDKNKNTVTTGAITRKQMIINPSFNPQNADMKVLFIVDDSYTMSQSQERLSAAVDSLLNPLEGRNVDFKIVSTSGVPDNQIDYEIQSSSLSSSTTQYQIKNHSNNRHLPLKSLQNFNSAQFLNLKNQIKSAILAVGTNGSNTEEGFCAAARHLFDSTTNRFFNNGDKAAIIFLTDEDDASTYGTCLAAYQHNTSSNQVVYYNYLQKRARIKLEYQVNRDGLVSWYPANWGISLASTNQFSEGTTCSSSDLNTALAQISSMGYTIQNVDSCIYESVASNYFGADLGDDGSNTSKNLCTSTVFFEGHSYANLYSYVTASNKSALSGSCTKQVVSSNSITASSVFTSVIESDLASNNSQDLRSGIINKANELFGTGFIIGSIIRRNGEACSLSPGQAYGTKYEQLSAQLPLNSAIETMCASQFSNILSRISHFIKNVAQRSYAISDMSSEERIIDVKIRRNNSLIPLTNSDFEAVGSTLTLTSFNLFQGDIIEVTYGN